MGVGRLLSAGGQRGLLCSNAQGLFGGAGKLSEDEIEMSSVRQYHADQFVMLGLNYATLHPVSK